MLFENGFCCFFSIKVVPHTQTHIDSVHGGVRMRLCRDCAQTQFDPSLHVGILYKTAAIEYASLVNSIEDQSSIQDKFMDDGLVVFDTRTATSARAAVNFQSKAQFCLPTRSSWAYRETTLSFVGW